MNSFDCLYLLENQQLYILEVKRNGLPLDTPLSDRSKWLRIAKHSLEITDLNVRSVDRSTEIEERYFDEGFLKFNNSIGTYIEKYNSAQHPLEKKTTPDLPAALAQSINNYLLTMQAKA